MKETGRTWRRLRELWACRKSEAGFRESGKGGKEEGTLGSNAVLREFGKASVGSPSPVQLLLKVVLHFAGT